MRAIESDSSKEALREKSAAILEMKELGVLRTGAPPVDYVTTAFFKPITTDKKINWT